MPRRPLKPKVRWRGSRHWRARRKRVGLRLAVVAFVAAVAGVLYLHVSLTRQFEGRLWLLPSRVYSDVLVLKPGMRIDLPSIAERLDRSGYARTSTAPDRSGRYTRSVRELQVYLRSFHAIGYDAKARRIRLRFGRGRLQSVTDPDGGSLDQAVLEPVLLATLFGPRQEERSLVRLDEVPDVLRDAVLAAEDSRFFSHHGLDIRGILRASMTNVRHGRIVQGGSTITQQTVKNLFLGQERTWRRKFREAAMSVLLDARYEKDRILEVYLNEVYLGQRGSVAICGIQAASRFYFGRDQRELSLAESAMLAGLIASPGRYNPFANPDAALVRRGLVLGMMERQGYATAEQVRNARSEKLNLASGSGGFAQAPYAVDYVQSRLEELYPPHVLSREGLGIYTTLDLSSQRHAEEALKQGLVKLEALGRGKTDEPLQAAIVVTDPSRAEILAMVGGRDYSESQFNRASQARRQPGSCFKPFVYAVGFELAGRGDESGFTPATMLEDSPLEMVSGGKVWKPKNYDKIYRGLVSTRRALEKSLNVPTVRAAQRVGLENVVQTARAMGIGSPLPALPSIALGAVEVTPVELASAYGSLARNGRYRPPRIVRGIIDQSGEELVPPEVEWRRVISPQAAYLVNDVLQGVLRRGTARTASALGFRGIAAGKTGTTDDTRDSWFVGYTSQLLALVWVGYDNNAATGFTGASGALPIWVDFMHRSGAHTAAAEFEVPDGIVQRRIDPTTGDLVQRDCPTWRDESFIEGSEPVRLCDKHGNRFQRWFRRLKR